LIFIYYTKKSVEIQ